jgi:hypothetical protein
MTTVPSTNARPRSRTHHQRPRRPAIHSHTGTPNHCATRPATRRQRAALKRSVSPLERPARLLALPGNAALVRGPQFGTSAWPRFRSPRTKPAARSHSRPALSVLPAIVSVTKRRLGAGAVLAKTMTIRPHAAGNAPGLDGANTGECSAACDCSGCDRESLADAPLSGPTRTRKILSRSPSIRSCSTPRTIWKLART